MNQRQRPGKEENPYRLGEKYFDENFGLLEIDWSGEAPRVKVEIRDLDGKAVIETGLAY